MPHPFYMMPEYVLPIPRDAESLRLDHQHHLFLRTIGGLSKAPLNTSRQLRILDIGCGNGNWATAFANQYPNAHILGLDITFSPTWTSAPSNCAFRLVNVEDPETWSSLPEQYDFIHCRMIVAFVQDWPRLLTCCFNQLAPDGWLEIQDLQFPIQCLGEVADRSTCKTLQWSDCMVKAGQIVGLSPAALLQVPYLLPRIGFHNVSLQDYQMIIGTWPEGEEDKELGRMGLENVRLGARGWSQKLFVDVLGMNWQEHQKLADEIYREGLERKVKAFLPLKVCMASKSREP